MVDTLKTDMKELYEKLCDPNYDVGEDCFNAVNIASSCYDTISYSNVAYSLIYMVLFRLYRDYPWVFAITICQFPYFDKLESYWKENGLYELDEHLWLKRKI